MGPGVRHTLIFVFSFTDAPFSRRWINYTWVHWPCHRPKAYIPTFGQHHQKKKKKNWSIKYLNTYILELSRLSCIIQTLSYWVTYHPFIIIGKFITYDILFIKSETSGLGKSFLFESEISNLLEALRWKNQAALKFEMPSALLPRQVALKSIWELEIGFRLFKGWEKCFGLQDLLKYKCVFSIPSDNIKDFLSLFIL